ncbi:MAG: DUF2798 domain-containing protein [Bacteroidales bacterium]
MKLNDKQANVLTLMVMVLVMTAVVTIVMSLLNGNFEVLKWLKGWGLSFIVAFPAVLVVLPTAKKVVMAIKN